MSRHYLVQKNGLIQWVDSAGTTPKTVLLKETVVDVYIIHGSQESKTSRMQV